MPDLTHEERHATTMLVLPSGTRVEGEARDVIEALGAEVTRLRAALSGLIDALGGEDDEPDAGVIGEAVDLGIAALEGGEQHGV